MKFAIRPSTKSPLRSRPENGVQMIKKIMKCVYIGVILTSAMLWHSASNYQLSLAFLICLCATVAIRQTIQARQYVWVNARTLAISIPCVLLSAALLRGEDLSRYRDFQFGMDLPAAVKQAGMKPS